MLAIKVQSLGERSPVTCHYLPVLSHSPPAFQTSHQMALFCSPTPSIIHFWGDPRATQPTKFHSDPSEMDLGRAAHCLRPSLLHRTRPSLGLGGSLLRTHRVAASVTQGAISCFSLFSLSGGDLAYCTETQSLPKASSFGYMWHVYLEA